MEQPSEALHEAGAGRHSEQDRAVHLLARGELREALSDSLGGNHYADLGALIVWHARGMPEDGCSTVSRSRGPSRVRNGWRTAIRGDAKIKKIGSCQPGRPRGTNPIHRRQDLPASIRNLGNGHWR
jgi:hypothetical protein